MLELAARGIWGLLAVSIVLFHTASFTHIINFFVFELATAVVGLKHTMAFLGFLGDRFCVPWSHGKNPKTQVPLDRSLR